MVSSPHPAESLLIKSLPPIAHDTTGVRTCHPTPLLGICVPLLLLLPIINILSSPLLSSCGYLYSFAFLVATCPFPTGAFDSNHRNPSPPPLCSPGPRHPLVHLLAVSFLVFSSVWLTFFSSDHWPGNPNFFAIYLQICSFVLIQDSSSKVCQIRVIKHGTGLY